MITFLHTHSSFNYLPVISIKEAGQNVDKIPQYNKHAIDRAKVLLVRTLYNTTLASVVPTKFTFSLKKH